MTCLALLGCKKNDTAAEGRSVPVPNDEVTGAWVDQRQGPAPLTVNVQLQTPRGLPARGTLQRVLVDGAELQASPDAAGHFAVELTTTGVHTIQVDGLDPVDVVVLDDWPGFGLSTTTPAPFVVTSARRQDGAWLLTTEQGVWEWLDDAGLRPLATNLPAAPHLSDLEDLDGDGVADLVVGSGDTVYFLRGQPGGSLGLHASRTADGAVLTDLVLRNMDGDDRPEVLVAWEGDGDGDVEVLWQDGLWNVAPYLPAELDAEPIGLAFGDNRDAGTEQATVYLSDGTWARFLPDSLDTWTPTGPELLVSVPDRAELIADVDLDGNHADELIFVAPYTSDNEREIFLLDIAGDNYSVSQRTPVGGQLTFGDGTGDRVTDMWTLDADGQLRIYTEPGGFPQDTLVAELPDPGPIGLTGDDTTLTVFGQESWRTITGQISTASGLSLWSPDRLGGLYVQAQEHDVAVAPAVPQGPDDHTWLTLRDGDTAPQIHRWRRPLDPDAPEEERTTVHANGLLVLEGLDLSTARLEVCGDLAWVWDQQQVHLVALTTPMVAVGSVKLAARDLSCDDDPTRVLAVTDAEILTLDATLTSVEQERLDAWSAARDHDGSLVSCNSIGCGLLVADGGLATVAEGWATLDDGRTLPAAMGALGDVDHDGTSDLVFVSGDLLTVVRTVDGRLARPEAYRLPDRDWTRVRVDRRGDESVLVVLDEAGRLYNWVQSDDGVPEMRDEEGLLSGSDTGL